MALHAVLLVGFALSVAVARRAPRRGPGPAPRAAGTPAQGSTAGTGDAPAPLAVAPRDDLGPVARERTARPGRGVSTTAPPRGHTAPAGPSPTRPGRQVAVGLGATALAVVAVVLAVGAWRRARPRPRRQHALGGAARRRAAGPCGRGPRGGAHRRESRRRRRRAARAGNGPGAVRRRVPGRAPGGRRGRGVGGGRVGRGAADGRRRRGRGRAGAVGAGRLPRLGRRPRGAGGLPGGRGVRGRRRGDVPGRRSRRTAVGALLPALLAVVAPVATGHVASVGGGHDIATDAAVLAAVALAVWFGRRSPSPGTTPDGVPTPRSSPGAPGGSRGWQPRWRWSGSSPWTAGWCATAGQPCTAGSRRRRSCWSCWPRCRSWSRVSPRAGP